MMSKNLRLSDLARRGRGNGLELLSVRLPVQLLDRVDELVDRIGGGKAEVVVALLNEGLERYEHRRSGRRS
jgi:metal-responsive CopG/Arc/MetJ family transcriptional regulator